VIEEFRARLTWRVSILLGVGVLLAACTSHGGVMPPGPTPTPPTNTSIVRLSTDIYTNSTSQHATQVEPDLFASGLTLVSVFQSGRFFDAGSSNVGFATSHDGGMSWIHGFLPGTTVLASPSGAYDRVSDPSVVFDAKHNVWLASTLPISFSLPNTPAALVNASTDGGLSWGLPVGVAPGQASIDKGWITCDNTVASPFYGTCYVQWDDPNAGGLIHMSRSTDGGATWSAPANTASNDTGIGGQPLVQPNGTVIVPISDFSFANILAFRSTDGGATWKSAVHVAAIALHGNTGNLRSGPLPSATIDAAGKVYVAWHDCKFRAGCVANDIVMSTSLDGSAWSAVSRVPIDALTSGSDHFIPGIGVDPTTSGGGAHLGITYYFYPNAACSPATCQLDVGFVSSLDGGITWGAPTTLAGPMTLSWLAKTNQGSMVGDYVATAFAGGHPYGVFAVANPPNGVILDESIYAPKPGIITALSAVRNSSAAEHPIPGARSDHASRIRPPII
jgi:hypothetical protein